DAAAESYAQVQKLDPDTHGLDEALQRVAEGRKRTRVQQLLSEGFNHLAASRFGDARSAFDKVLGLEPGNSVATSGLEQVARQSVIARINALKEQADRAAAQERWEQAAELYGKVLE